MLSPEHGEAGSPDCSGCKLDTADAARHAQGEGSAGNDPDLMRILHTMLRVNDLEQSLAFYTGVLGMKLLRKKNYESGRFTLAFVGYGDEESTAVLELTHNWDTKSYTLGDAFGHVAIGTEDIYATCERIRSAGGKIVREPGPMKHGSTVIAFIEDPNGYRIELIETKR